MPIAAFTKLYELIKGGKLLSDWRATLGVVTEILGWAKGLGVGGNSPGVLRSVEPPSDDEAAAICDQLRSTPHDAEAAIDPQTILRLVSWILAFYPRLFGG